MAQSYEHHPLCLFLINCREWNIQVMNLPDAITRLGLYYLLKQEYVELAKDNSFRAIQSPPYRAADLLTPEIVLLSFLQDPKSLHSLIQGLASFTPQKVLCEGGYLEKYWGWKGIIPWIKYRETDKYKNALDFIKKEKIAELLLAELSETQKEFVEKFIHYLHKLNNKVAEIMAKSQEPMIF